MRIQVNGKQMDVGAALTTHVEDRLTDTVSKFSTNAVEAIVTFSKDRYEHVCDISVHLSTGLTTKAQGRSKGDVYDSFDGGLSRMEKQLRRYKRRLKDHHKERSDPIEMIGVSSYVIETNSDDDVEEPESLQPVIVAEMETALKSLSVGEAVMQMELDGAPVLVFRNDAHGGVNVVYQREDGNIGWVDPHDNA